VVTKLEATRTLTVLALRQGASPEEARVWARDLVGPVPWSLPALRRAWNEAKDDAAPWWHENSKEAYSSGLDGLARALDNWTTSRAGGRRHVGFPTRKKKGKRPSCRFTTGAIGIPDDRHAKLPRIGTIRVKEKAAKLQSLVDGGRARILSATVSEEAGRFYVSFTCEVERQDAPAVRPDALVGVDLGVTHLAVVSDGTVVKNPKALSRYERRMKRLSRELARRQGGSKRARRTRTSLARCHRKVANLRRDGVAKLTSELATGYGTVVVEDLGVRGMTAAPKPVQNGTGAHLNNGRGRKAALNRAVLDASLAEIRRQLAYKLAWRGGTLLVADRFFPSSKLCSSCGAAKATLTLAERIFNCESCGLKVDRDLNAARNLAAYGQRHVAGSGPATQNARGGGHPRRKPQPPVKREDGTAAAGKTVTAAPQDAAA